REQDALSKELLNTLEALGGQSLARAQEHRTRGRLKLFDQDHARTQRLDCHRDRLYSVVGRDGGRLYQCKSGVRRCDTWCACAHRVPAQFVVEHVDELWIEFTRYFLRPSPSRGGPSLQIDCFEIAVCERDDA